jgi:hypothetical protein
MSVEEEIDQQDSERENLKKLKKEYAFAFKLFWQISFFYLGIIF